MRSIVRDLRERLTELAFERESHQRRLDEIAKQETLLQELLKEEQKRWAMGQLRFVGLERDKGAERPHTLWSRFLLDTLGDGRERSLAELKRLAEQKGMNSEGKQLGRVLHFALVGMAKHRLVEMVARGRWRLKLQLSSAAKE